jgi:tricarballylate dehydrogenase
VHETWKWFARTIHFETPGSRAYAILDSCLFDIAGFQWGDPIGSAAPSSRYNRRACGPDRDRCVASRRDGCELQCGGDRRSDQVRCNARRWTGGLHPPESNWARTIANPPFLAYPLIGAIAYTFGGFATNAKAEVLGNDGPLAGLYAAGEITGHFYGTAPNAVSILRALVFGRIAGLEAISYFEGAGAYRT